jgi:hypothetical protein
MNKLPQPSRRIALLVLSFSLVVFALAQDQSADSTRTLSTDLDTTILVDPPAEVKEQEETDTGITKVDEEKTDYFLPVTASSWSGDSIVARKIPPERREAMQRDGAFWYANKSFRKKERSKGGSSITEHPAFQFILWLIIIGCFAFGLILYLSNSNVSLFRKNRNISDAEMEEETDDIFGINYQKEIEKATKAGDYRLAIRLMFLRQLKKLSDRNIIQYTHDRTNFDYLLQMRSSNLYGDFFRLTRNYEYSWYGQFDIDAGKFSLISKEFDNFDRKMH